MLELLTKEYIVASILAWLQTLYFLFKVRRGHMIKKQNNLLCTVRQSEKFMGPCFPRLEKHFLSFLADLQFDFYFVEQDVEYLQGYHRMHWKARGDLRQFSHFCLDYEWMYY